jgi:UDP-glucose 4-epimerase
MQRSDFGPSSASTVVIIRRRMVPAFAITFTSMTFYLRAAGASATLNCGYGHGVSVREVVEMVKRISGVNFKVEITPRRAGDPAQIVAAYDCARAMLGWTPQYDNLATIIAHALAWEQRLGGPYHRMVSK